MDQEKRRFVFGLLAGLVVLSIAAGVDASTAEENETQDPEDLEFKRRHVTGGRITGPNRPRIPRPWPPRPTRPRPPSRPGRGDPPPGRPGPRFPGPIWRPPGI